MFIIKYKLVNGCTEFQETDKFTFGPKNDLHPEILEATLYTSDGKKLHKIKRRHQKRYIHYEYKPEQTVLKPEN